MQKPKIKKRLIPSLLAAVYTIPALTGCDNSATNKEQPQPMQEALKTTINSEMLRQEVIQVLRQGETDFVTLNIAGQPGTYFRIHYSRTGNDDSYVLLPNGEGMISDNGFSSVGFALKQLAENEVYLKVTTSDTADFTETRVTPKPMILEVDQIEIKERDVYQQLRQKVNQLQKKHEIRTPSAVAGVRG